MYLCLVTISDLFSKKDEFKKRLIYIPAFHKVSQQFHNLSIYYMEKHFLFTPRDFF